jgi:hypothetical protein
MERKKRTEIRQITIAYVFDLYQKATPGEKLTILYLPIGGIIGWFLNKWFSKKEKN